MFSPDLSSFRLLAQFSPYTSLALRLPSFYTLHSQFDNQFPILYHSTHFLPFCPCRFHSFAPFTCCLLLCTTHVVYYSSQIYMRAFPFHCSSMLVLEANWPFTLFAIWLCFCLLVLAISPPFSQNSCHSTIIVHCRSSSASSVITGSSSCNSSHSPSLIYSLRTSMTNTNRNGLSWTLG